MMKKLRIKILGMLAFGTLALHAQQDNNYTLYRNNLVLQNPAHGGAEEQSELGISLRSQWSGVQDAPVTQAAFLSTKLKGRLGLGVVIVNDQVFIERQTYASIGLSYQLRLATETELFFGINAGAHSYDADLSSLNNAGGDGSLSRIDGTFTPNFGVGAYLKHKQHFLSLSMPKVLSTDRLQSRSGDVVVGPSRQHINFAAGTEVILSRNVDFKPSTMVRYVANAPTSVDITAMLDFENTLDFGMNYRINEALGVLTFLNIQDWGQLGYAYQFAQDSDLTATNGGTHEFSLKLIW